MNLRAVVLVAACSVVFAPSVSARTAGDQVRVTFTDGRVTVVADNATVSEILQEWARVGGSKFVNAEKIPSTERVTLRLENQTEVRALEVLLRSVAGYMVAPRTAGMPGSSSIGRVLIMPVSQASSFAQVAPRSQPAPSQNEMPALPQMIAGPPRPDDDGPVRQMPPPPANTAPVTGTAQTSTGAPASSSQPAPIGQASPLGATKTQTAPGIGPTSAQPGVVIPAPPRPGGGRPTITPTQPRPGGGG